MAAEREIGHGDCMGASSGAASARRNVEVVDGLGNHWDAAVRVLIEREAREELQSAIFTTN